MFEVPNALVGEAQSCITASYKFNARSNTHTSKLVVELADDFAVCACIFERPAEAGAGRVGLRARMGWGCATVSTWWGGVGGGGAHCMYWFFICPNPCLQPTARALRFIKCDVAPAMMLLQCWHDAELSRMYFHVFKVSSMCKQMTQQNEQVASPAVLKSARCSNVGLIVHL